MIARHSGPAVKGEVTLLVTILSFIIFFSNILGGQALIYLIPRNKIDVLIVPAYFWSLLISIAGYVFLSFSGITHEQNSFLIALLGFLSAIVSIHQTILLAKKEISKSNLLTIFPLIFQVSGVVLCFWFFDIQNSSAYIYSSVAAFSVTIVISLFFTQKYLKGIGMRIGNFEELKQSFRFGLSFQLTEVLQLLNLRWYFFPLGLQQGWQYLGIFSIGISIFEAVWIIPRSIATVHYVSISNTGEIRKEKERTWQLMKQSFALCFAALLVIFLLPNSFYTTVFGSGFAHVKHAVRFLYPGILIYSVWLVVSSFYFGIGKYKPLIVSSLAGAITLIILSFFLIPKYVMSGAGLAASISMAISTLLLLTLFIKQRVE